MKNLKLTAIFFIGLLAVSCEDDLNVSPTNTLADGTFWNTESDAIQAATGVYATFAQYEMQRYQILEAIVYSDNATLPWANAASLTLGKGQFDPAHPALVRLWNYLYQIIRDANTFLANIDKPVMDESLRGRLKGEITFLRAYTYNILITYWGGVPLITEPLPITDLKIGRTPKKEVVDFLLNDLDEVVDDLPLSYDAPNLGRVTRGAALALKARIALFDERWQIAKEASSTVMDMGVYRLFRNSANMATSYEQIWDQVNENNSEVVFDLQYLGERNQSRFQNWSFAPGMAGIGGPCPYQGLVDEYECTDGLPISESPLYQTSDPFANRDPRLDMSIIKHGDTYRGVTFDMYDGPNSPGNGNATRSGYYVRKLLDDQYQLGEYYWDTNMILMRYAEVLLTYAEAKIELGELDQTVLDALNDIRARAYGVELNDVDDFPDIQTLDDEELITYLRRERRVELAFEGIRAYDIRRWRIADEVINGPSYGYRSDNGTGDHIIVDQKTFNAPRDFLWPIPQAEIDLIGKDILIQNDGY